ncbi:hypothetical protein TNIN_21251 [Trichonephila inaurata madagascariensis]|uniref:Uncharacterized protein n=1 Tax=Trichonephila inaurata madagascariensis TaxID=2747483 RepID=A0A8X6YDR3_9ARAC|nr:hypothetical protein TNIN_21251 [Trichonephila inaurata madagascariensis]
MHAGIAATVAKKALKHIPGDLSTFPEEMEDGCCQETFITCLQDEKQSIIRKINIPFFFTSQGDPDIRKSCVKKCSEMP